MFGIHVVLTAEPKPVTVCSTEPSCNNFAVNHGKQFLRYHTKQMDLIIRDVGTNLRGKQK